VSCIALNRGSDSHQALRSTPRRCTWTGFLYQRGRQLFSALGAPMGATAFCTDSAATTFNGLLAAFESGPGSHSTRFWRLMSATDVQARSKNPRKTSLLKVA